MHEAVNPIFSEVSKYSREREALNIYGWLSFTMNSKTRTNNGKKTFLFKTKEKEEEEEEEESIFKFRGRSRNIRKENKWRNRETLFTFLLKKIELFYFYFFSQDL